MLTLSVARMMVNLVEPHPVAEAEVDVETPARRGLAAALRRLVGWRFGAGHLSPAEIAGVAQVATPVAVEPAATGPAILVPGRVPDAPLPATLVVPVLRPVLPRIATPAALHP